MSTDSTFRFVLNISRAPGNQRDGAGVQITYDSENPAVSIVGTPYPNELKFLHSLVEVCEAKAKGFPIRVVRGDQ